MTVCSKCGRRLPESKFRVLCFCSEKNLVTMSSFPVEELNSREMKPIPDISQGPKVWLAIHSYKYVSKENCVKFYQEWRETIPSYGCSCKKEWVEIETQNPPNFESAEGFFEWGVKVHNIVNERLHKPIMPLETAKKVYNIMSPS